MRRRNWWLILPISVALGFAVFRFWGAIVAPVVAVAFFVFRDRALGNTIEADQNARLAAFIEAQAKSHTAATPVGLLPIVRPLPQSDLPPLPSAAPKPSRPVSLSREQAVARSVSLALVSNDLPLAVALVREWAGDIEAIRLQAKDWDRLGGAALECGEFLVAGRAQEAAALATGDEALAQKRLLEAAAWSSEAGRPEIARDLYGRLLARYPASPYENFARAGIERITSQGTSVPG